jgi:hypothetical protein
VSACVAKQLKDFGNQNEETRRRLVDRISLSDEMVTEDLPTQIGTINISYLSWPEIYDRYKSHTKTRKKNERLEIPFTVIRPMKNEAKALIIRLTDHWYSKRKNMITQSLEGGCRVSFEFDVDKDDFVLTKTELWGV